MCITVCGEGNPHFWCFEMQAVTTAVFIIIYYAFCMLYFPFHCIYTIHWTSNTTFHPSVTYHRWHILLQSFNRISGGKKCRITGAVYSPTLSTPYLWPATWCVSGTHPFRWGAWPWGPRDLWMHFSIVGDAPEIRGVRLTPRSTELGLSSRRPRDSINTWRWVVDICRNRKKNWGGAQSLCPGIRKKKINKSTTWWYRFTSVQQARHNLQVHERWDCPGVTFREYRTIQTTATSARPRFVWNTHSDTEQHCRNSRCVPRLSTAPETEPIQWSLRAEWQRKDILATSLFQAASNTHNQVSSSLCNLQNKTSEVRWGLRCNAAMVWIGQFRC